MDMKIRQVVADLHKLLKFVPKMKVVLIRREANAVANWVATNTRKETCESGWSRQLPSPLVGILDKDDLPAPP